MTRLRIAARRSHLARLQAELVGRALKSKFPKLIVDYHWMTSKGDVDLTTPLHRMPDKGVFTADLTQGLINGDFDAVVHSWKDIPTEENPDTVIAATLPRADARDVLLFKRTSVGRTDVTISSSSPRREYNGRSFLKAALPWKVDEIVFQSVRGNIPTRIAKFLEGGADGIMLAKAALDRLLASSGEGGAESDELKSVLNRALDACRFMVLPLSVDPAAPAQGALAIEARRDRVEVVELFSAVNAREDFECVEVERRILRGYGGGCHQKIGATVIKRDFGKVLFVRGETDDGEKLERAELLDREPAAKVLSRNLFPLSLDEVGNRERESFELGSLPQASQMSQSDLWIAREDALPNDFVPSDRQAVWAAGVKTWRKLAARGVWVNGCADGLGENEDPAISRILRRESRFLKLTHEAAVGLSHMPVLATYRIKDDGAKINLKGKTHFFWPSYSTFKKAVSLQPEIKSGNHASGPGLTAKLIGQYLGRPVEIFVSHEEWLRTYKGD